MQRATKAVPGRRTLPVGAAQQPRQARQSTPFRRIRPHHGEGGGADEGALLDVPGLACVAAQPDAGPQRAHPHRPDRRRECNRTSKWADRYRKIQTQKLLAAMKLKSLESETSKPISPRIESSMVASRLTFGSKLTQAEREFVLGTLETMRRPTLLEPMSRSPRGRLPPHYGRTLHTDAAPYYGIDLRSG